MINEETARELEKLREDVASLSDVRKKAADKLEDALDEIAIPEELKTQLEELGKLLQAEIRDLPAITCLAIFALGVLMGRMMR